MCASHLITLMSASVSVRTVALFFKAEPFRFVLENKNNSQARIDTRELLAEFFKEMPYRFYF